MENCYKFSRRNSFWLVQLPQGHLNKISVLKRFNFARDYCKDGIFHFILQKLKVFVLWIILKR